MRDIGQHAYNGGIITHTPAPFRFVTDDYFDLIEKLNNFEYDDSLDLPITKDLFYNNLFSKEESLNTIALDLLVSGGYIDVDQHTKYSESIHNVLTTMNNSNLTYTMEGTIFNLEVTEPLVLDRRYINTTSNLYLLFNNYSIIGESGVSPSELIPITCSRCNEERYNYQPAPFRKFYNPDLNLVVNQSSYFAFKISNFDGDGDIKFDRTDIIDVVDNFKISVEIPQIIIGDE